MEDSSVLDIGCFVICMDDYDELLNRAKLGSEIFSVCLSNCTNESKLRRPTIFWIGCKPQFLTLPRVSFLLFISNYGKGLFYYH